MIEKKFGGKDHEFNPNHHFWHKHSLSDADAGRLHDRAVREGWSHSVVRPDANREDHHYKHPDGNHMAIVKTKGSNRALVRGRVATSDHYKKYAKD